MSTSAYPPIPPSGPQVYTFWLITFTGGPEGETTMVVNAGQPELNLAGTVLAVPFFGRDQDGRPNMTRRYYPLAGGRIASWQKAYSYSPPPHLQPGSEASMFAADIPKEWLENEHPW